MTSPKVREFLRVRDGAYARGDVGIIRSMNAELRRLGVPDDATLTHPSGRPSGSRRRQTVPAPQHGRKMPRCEHNNVAERCPICNEEIPEA